MINCNSKVSVCTFNPITADKEPNTAQLTNSKDKGSFINIADVRGTGGGIEKMTHPSAQVSETDLFSPYMIELLGKTTALAFAEKVLQAPRQQLLDSLGIDDTQKTERQTKLHSDQITISRFYTHSVEPKPSSITLNGSPFIEQEPTNPYFINQKIITHDFRVHRDNEDAHRLNLLQCKSRDDSEVFFDKEPILQLQQYNASTYQHESHLRDDGKLQNNAHYFTEMVSYLAQRGSPGDFIVQNSLESSSDRTTAHFQYIPDDVILPIFAHTPRSSDISEAKIMDWYLPSVWSTFDLSEPDWIDASKKLQHLCQELLDSQHISTTPLFRKLEGERVDAFLIFKKDCSIQWNMTPESIQNTPGWLEASGIFIANSGKSEVFERLGARAYYESYRVTAESMDTINRIFADVLTRH